MNCKWIDRRAHIDKISRCLPQIQNDQCQEMDQAGSEKWIKLTSNGEWRTHTVGHLLVLLNNFDNHVNTLTWGLMLTYTCTPQVNLKSGTNILYWRTTGMLLGGKPVKPVLLKNIQIEGVRCFDNNVYFLPFNNKSHPSVLSVEVRSTVSYCDVCVFWVVSFESRRGVHVWVFPMQTGHLQ